MARSARERKRLYEERDGAATGDTMQPPPPVLTPSEPPAPPPPPDTARAIDNHGFRKGTINALLRAVLSPSNTTARVFLEALTAEGFSSDDVFDLAEHFSNAARLLHTLRIEQSAKERASPVPVDPRATWPQGEQT